MPYQPTNPYPYNIGVDLREGLTLQFKVDNYDTIIRFEIEIYDLFKSEKIYTINREIGDIKVVNGKKQIVEGTKQIIQIFDDTNTLIYFDYYEGESVLPVKGGLAEESICKIELTNYLKTIEQIKNEAYYGNVDDYTDFEITELNDPSQPGVSYYILDENSYIIGINSNYTYVFDELTKLVIPYEINNNIVRGIGDNVFANLTNLEEVIIPSSIYEIKNNVFQDCSSLESVCFNYGLTIIGNSVFENCNSLTSIKLLDSIATLGDNCFKNCSNLTDIVLSNSLKVIPEYCFVNDISLVNLDLKKVETISGYAFSNCSNLSKINFPEKLKVIKSYAFQNCNSIYEVVLYNELQTIEEFAFWGCNNIVKMILPFVGKNQNAIGKEGLFGYIFGETDSTGILQKSSTTEEYYFAISPYISQIELTNEIEIPYGAFYNCREIIRVILNEGITEIGDYAFYNCYYLKEIDFPSTVTSIGEQAFGVEEVSE